MRTEHLLVLAFGLSLGCAETHGGEAVSTSASTQGDTAVVTISAPESLPALLVTLDSARVIWTPEELGRPNGMAVGPDGRLMASDGRHLYARQPGADTTEVVSREGAGPGEYRSVRALLAEDDGSFLVLDARQRRMIHFAHDGAPDSTWSLNRDFAQVSFMALMNDSPVILVGPRLVRTGEPPDTLYLKPASGDTAAVLGRLTQYVWAQAPGGMLLPRDAYPPQALVAGTASGGFAFSDGLQYEVRWWRPDASPRWLRISRAWAPPPTSSDREPPDSLLSQMRGGGTQMREMVGGMQRGSHKYSLEDVELMPGGTLWTRPIDSSYVYHPWYYNSLSELRQPTRLWEVFGRDGKLRAQVRLSSMFTPKTVRACQLYGFLEDNDGAYSIAAIPLGKECKRLAQS